MVQHAPIRRHRRYSLTVPIEFRGTRGFTRNLSLCGIYFESSVADVAPGALIRFALVLQAPSGSSPEAFRLSGRVM